MLALKNSSSNNSQRESYEVILHPPRQYRFVMVAEMLYLSSTGSASLLAGVVKVSDGALYGELYLNGPEKEEK